MFEYVVFFIQLKPVHSRCSKDEIVLKRKLMKKKLIKKNSFNLLELEIYIVRSYES